MKKKNMKNGNTGFQDSSVSLHLRLIWWFYGHSTEAEHWSSQDAKMNDSVDCWCNQAQATSHRAKRLTCVGAWWAQKRMDKCIQKVWRKHSNVVSSHRHNRNGHTLCEDEIQLLNDQVDRKINRTQLNKSQLKSEGGLGLNWQFLIGHQDDRRKERTHSSIAGWMSGGG